MIGRSDPQLEYDFVTATKEDFTIFVEMCCKEFIKLEPHARAAGLVPDEAQFIPLFTWLVEKCLHTPYSLKVLEKSTGTIVAIRCMSVAHRNKSLDWEPFHFDWEQMSENGQKVERLLAECTDGFWNSVDPLVQKVIHREISFVLPEHQRKGIAQSMATFGLDFEKLRAEGFDGIVSDAMSLANQKLLKKNGYKTVYIPKPYDWAERLDDGTKTVKVLFKDIRF